MPRRLLYEVDVDSRQAVAGSNRAERAIEGIGREAQQARNRVRAFGSGLDDLGRRAGRARTAFAGIAAGLGAIATGAAVGAISRVVEGSASLGASLVETASAAGVTVRQLEELRRAFSEDGAEIQQVDRLLVALNARISDAAQGNEQYAESLRALGVDARDSQGNIVSASAAIDQLAANLDATNFDEAVAHLQRLVGEEGLAAVAPALQRSSAEFQAARSRVDELGLSIGNQANELKDLAQVLSDVRERITAVFARTVARNADEIAVAVEAIGRAATDAGPLLADLTRHLAIFTVGLGEFSRQQVAEFRASIEGLRIGLSAVVPGLGLLSAGVEDVGESADDARSSTDDLERALLGLRETVTVAVQDIPASLRPVSVAIGEITGDLIDYRTNLRDVLQFDERDLDTARTIEALRRQEQIRQAHADRLARIAREEAEALQRAGLEAAGIVTNIEIDPTLFENVGAGAKETLADLEALSAQTQDWENLSKSAASALGSTFAGIASDFDGLGDSLRRTVQFIAGELLRLALIQPLISELATGLGLPGFQHGGLADRGFAVVGEGGPEIVDFRSPGRVYTNRQLAAALNVPGGGGGITFAPTIQSADGPGVERALLRLLPQFESLIRGAR